MEHLFRPEDLQIKNSKADLLPEYTSHLSDSVSSDCELDVGKEKPEMTRQYLTRNCYRLSTSKIPDTGPLTEMDI